MIYPIYVHPGDDQHAHGVILPDFPGCFSAADSWQGLPAAVQEAVEVWFEGDATDIPQPSALDQLTQDDNYQDGIWMLIDIDTTHLADPS